MNSVFITGASRGLGLEFCRHYADAGWEVIACCRNPHVADDLNRLAQRNPRINVHQLDVTDHAAVDRLAQQLSDRRIDVLVANAGVYSDSAGHGFGNIDYSAWRRTMETNLFGVIKVAEAFAPHLKRSDRPVIAALSSLMGSMTDNSSGGSLLYRSSKAALNAVMKSLAIDLNASGIGVLIFHPGWVKTDMGGPHALIDTKTSVAGMVQQIAAFKLSQSGSFLKYDGSACPFDAKRP